MGGNRRIQDISSRGFKERRVQNCSSLESLFKGPHYHLRNKATISSYKISITSSFHDSSHTFHNQRLPSHTIKSARTQLPHMEGVPLLGVAVENH